MDKHIQSTFTVLLPIKGGADITSTSSSYKHARCMVIFAA